MALAWAKYLSSSLSHFLNVTGPGSYTPGTYSLKVVNNTVYLAIYHITSLLLRLGVLQTSGS